MLQASAAVRMMLAPRREYRGLLAASRSGSWPRTLAWPALTALLLGIVTAIAATGRVTIPLVASQTICWSFAPALQLLLAALLVRSAPARHAGLARSTELLFAAHGPWSFWLMWAAIAPAVTSNMDLIVVSGVLATLWTSLLMFVFCREALGLTRGQAVWRTAAHQLATWLLILTYIELVSQLLIRVAGAVEP